MDRPSWVATTAGLASDQVDRLVIAVFAHGSLDPAHRRAVGPYRAILALLIYLRHNLSQALVAALFGYHRADRQRGAGRRRAAVALDHAGRRLSRTDR